MEEGRRRLLKIAGLTAIGLAGRGPLELVLGSDEAFAASTETGDGPRWAMLIDARKCLREEGCTECVRACHVAHNVPSMPDSRHEVKWIWKEDFPHAFPEQEVEFIDEALIERKVLVFCNHCGNPPCVRVCPTKATWKREDGVVMMDWHRCIGCRYCVAGCPYGSRSFNWVDPRPHIANITQEFPTRSKGVVEKCTFCEERLAKNQLPACVESCKEGALMFGDLNDAHSELREVLRSRFAIRRKPGLGTHPAIYYLV